MPVPNFGTMDSTEFDPLEKELSLIQLDSECKNIKGVIFKFINNKSYHQDRRLLQLILSYCNDKRITKEEKESLHSQILELGISKYSAQLYIYLSKYYENDCKSYVQAEHILRVGLSYEAEPIYILKNTLETLLSRITTTKNSSVSFSQGYNRELLMVRSGTDNYLLSFEEIRARDYCNKLEHSAAQSCSTNFYNAPTGDSFIQSMEVNTTRHSQANESRKTKTKDTTDEVYDIFLAENSEKINPEELPELESDKHISTFWAPISENETISSEWFRNNIEHSSPFIDKNDMDFLFHQEKKIRISTSECKSTLLHDKSSNFNCNNSIADRSTTNNIIAESGKENMENTIQIEHGVESVKEPNHEMPLLVKEDDQDIILESHSKAFSSDLKNCSTNIIDYDENPFLLKANKAASFSQTVMTDMPSTNDSSEIKNHSIPEKNISTNNLNSDNDCNESSSTTLNFIGNINKSQVGETSFDSPFIASISNQVNDSCKDSNGNHPQLTEHLLSNHVNPFDFSNAKMEISETNCTVLPHLSPTKIIPDMKNSNEMCMKEESAILSANEIPDTLQTEQRTDNMDIYRDAKSEIDNGKTLIHPIDNSEVIVNELEHNQTPNDNVNFLDINLPGKAYIIEQPSIAGTKLLSLDEDFTILGQSTFEFIGSPLSRLRQFLEFCDKILSSASVSRMRKSVLPRKSFTTKASDIAKLSTDNYLFTLLGHRYRFVQKLSDSSFLIQEFLSGKETLLFFILRLTTKSISHNEMSIVCRLNDMHLYSFLSLEDNDTVNDSCFIFAPFFSQHTLKDVIETSNIISSSTEEIVSILLLRSLLELVFDLHSKNIAHGSFNPEDILFILSDEDDDTEEEEKNIGTFFSLAFSGFSKAIILSLDRVSENKLIYEEECTKFKSLVTFILQIPSISSDLNFAYYNQLWLPLFSDLALISTQEALFGVQIKNKYVPILDEIIHEYKGFISPIARLKRISILLYEL